MADGINCKHENGLALSLTFLILNAYIKRSLKFAVYVEFGQFGDKERVTEFLFESVFRSSGNLRQTCV